MSMIGNLRRATDVAVARLLANPKEIRAFLYGEPDRHEDRADVRLDKAWHGIHFVLTGSGWGGEPPLNFMVSGGTEVGDEDMGYGPARAFTSAEVPRIHEALAAIPPEESSSASASAPWPRRASTRPSGTARTRRTATWSTSPPTTRPFGATWKPSHETGSGCSSTSTESWNVEQREGWLVACRRLATRYDRQAASVLALLHLACALIWLRYLAHAELK